MDRPSVDLPSLFVVLSFTANIIVCFFYPTEFYIPEEVGTALLIFGVLFFCYVLFYLKGGFFGETEPRLDYLITKGPYKFCRHPLYLSFIITILGIDLMFRSIIGFVFIFLVSIPSAVYRAKVEDKLLRDKFGQEWQNYADEVGFLLPKFRRRS